MMCNISITAALELSIISHYAVYHIEEFTYDVLKSFVWQDQRSKVYIIYHKVHLRCEEYFIEQQHCFVLYWPLSYLISHIILATIYVCSYIYNLFTQHKQS